MGQTAQLWEEAANIHETLQPRRPAQRGYLYCSRLPIEEWMLVRTYMPAWLLQYCKKTV